MVIAIIAILAAILFPVFSSAKVAAKRTHCASQMRQIGLGMALYCDDYDGMFPGSGHSAPSAEGAWVFQMRSYLGNVDAIRICPADPNGARRKAAGGTSYVLNEWLVVPGAEWFPNRDQLARPSDTITTFTVSDEQGVAWTADHTHGRGWIRPPFANNWNRILADIQPDRFRQGLARGRQRTVEGSANYLYADTHVRAIPAQRVRGWANENFDFGKPPAE